MDTEQPAPGAQPARTPHRSPNHPAFSLEKALGKVDKLIQQARTTATPFPVACKYMGVSHTSSSGLRWLATIQEFGLVDVDGRGEAKTIKVSERARVLLKHPDRTSPVYRQALQDAALAPKMHRRVWELRHDGHLPPDDSLRYTLAGPEWGFSEGSAAEFVAQMRETIAFAGLTGDEQEGDTPALPPNGDPEAAAAAKNIKSTTAAPSAAPAWKPAMTPSDANGKDIPLPLQSGGTAVLHLPYLLDESDYEWLSGLLRGLKRSMLAPPTADRPATPTGDEEVPS